MDDLDYRIVNFLIADGRMAYARIAREVGCSTATVHQRVKRLKERKVIKNFTARVDWEAFNYPVAAVVSVRDGSSCGLAELSERLRAIPFIETASAVTGEFDLLLRVRARSSSHLGEVLDEIRRIAPGPSRTVVTLSNYFEAHTPPLPA